jgi:hypothetical protein
MVGGSLGPGGSGGGSGALGLALGGDRGTGGEHHLTDAER